MNNILSVLFVMAIFGTSCERSTVEPKKEEVKLIKCDTLYYYDVDSIVGDVFLVVEIDCD